MPTVVVTVFWGILMGHSSLGLKPDIFHVLAPDVRGLLSVSPFQVPLGLVQAASWGYCFSEARVLAQVLLTGEHVPLNGTALSPHPPAGGLGPTT